MWEIPTGLDNFFIPPFWKHSCCQGIWLLVISAGCGFPPNKITDMVKVGWGREWELGESVGPLCQLRCQILHVWVLFPPGSTLCNHSSVIYAYWKGWLCFQEISLSWGDQNPNVDGGRASFRWSLQRHCDLKEQGEESTLSLRLSSLEAEAQRQGWVFSQPPVQSGMDPFLNSDFSVAGQTPWPLGIKVPFCP